MRHPVVMGNWKLNGSKEMVVDSLNGLNAELEGVTGVDVAVAPPALSLILQSVRLLKRAARSS